MPLLLVGKAASMQNESADLIEMPKYLVDFIESDSVSLWVPTYLTAVLHQMKAHVVVSAASV